MVFVFLVSEKVLVAGKPIINSINVPTSGAAIGCTKDTAMKLSIVFGLLVFTGHILFGSTMWLVTRDRHCMRLCCCQVASEITLATKRRRIGASKAIFAVRTRAIEVLLMLLTNMSEPY